MARLLLEYDWYGWGVMRQLTMPIELLAAKLSAIFRSRATALRARWRTLSLVQQFLLMASVVILAGMVTIGLWVADRIKSGVNHRAAADAALHMDNFVAPLIQELAYADTLSDHAKSNLDALLPQMIGTRVASVKVWRPDGTVVYSNWHPLVGQRFPLNSELPSRARGRYCGRVRRQAARRRQQ